MTWNNVRTLLWACMLGSILSVGSVFSLISGFSLPTQNPCRMVLLWVCTAFLCGILFQHTHGKRLFLLLTAFFCGYLWRLGAPVRQSLQLLGKIGEILNWSIPIPPGIPLRFDYPLTVLGCGIAAAVGFWVCHGRGFYLAAAGVLLPMVPCFIATDAMPASPYLLLAMTGLGILILTRSARNRSIFQANRLTAVAFLPILVAVSVLFLAVPRSGYVDHTQYIRQQLLCWAQTVPTRLADTVAPLSLKPDDRVSLGSLGPQSPTGQLLFTVTSQASGALYLRGRDYDCYTGKEWTSTPNRAEVFSPSREIHNTLSIRTETALDFYFLPYYPSQAVVLSEGVAPNPEKIRQYTIYAGIPGDNTSSSEIPEDIYLTLPEGVDYTPILNTIFPDNISSTGAKATAIAGFIRNSAVYDLNTEKAPEDVPDFALWFLKDAQRGYCTHFAAAAAVLLRAAGIPSRYVTGFLVQTQAGKATPVTPKEAHAWAEYFDAKLGRWLILEATPTGTGGDHSSPEEAIPASAPTTPSPAFPSEAETASNSPVTVQKAASAFESGLLTWGAITALLWLTIQRRLRLILRRKRQTHGPANAQALARWQEALFLSRLLKQPPDENLLNLAQKASFSPHDLNESELACFDAYLRFCRYQLSQKPRHIRWIHKYLYAAY